MPCYTARKVTHDVGKWIAERAIEAIKLAGMYGIVEYIDGQLVQTETSEKLMNSRIVAVKKAYTELTVKSAVSKYGFQIKGQVKTAAGVKLFVKAGQR